MTCKRIRMSCVPLFAVVASALSLSYAHVASAAAKGRPVPVSAAGVKKSPVAAKLAPEAWKPSFIPLFKGLTAPPRTYFVDAVGVEFEGLNVTQQAAATRLVQIKQMEVEFRALPSKSQAALNIGIKLAKLLEEQAAYVEYLRASGGSDSRYPDLVQFARSQRVQHVNFIERLVKQFPKNERIAELRPIQLISRLKMGDPTARADALKFVGQGGSADQQRVALVGIVTDHESGKSSSPFGSLEFAAGAASDAGSRAAFRYLMAEEAMAKKNASVAVPLYQESLRDFNARFRRPDGKPAPLTLRVMQRLHQAALLRDPLSMDSEVMNSMRDVGALDAAHSYGESVALNNLAKQPSRAAKIYEDVLSFAEVSSAVRLNIELRVLDIYLASKDLNSAQSQWERVFDASESIRSQLLSRIIYSQNITHGQAVAKPDGENVARFVSMHDYFAEKSIEYAAIESWTLRVIELLMRSKRYSDVASRADALAGRTKSRETLLVSLRYSLRARESILGIAAEPKFSAGGKLQGDDQIAQAYVVTLDKLRPVVSGAELEQTVYQAAYVTQLQDQQSAARQRFEEALNKFSRSRFAGESISYLLAIAQSSKEWPYVEKLARLGLKNKITPARPEHKNLTVILENAVYSHAQQLSAAGQFEPSGNRFAAFQREFPNHKNAATALDLAARNFLQAKKTEAALNHMELLLKTYPSSGYVKETLWQAGELARGIAQFLRASKHYEDFARKYPQDGIKRTAWLKSAEMHKSLGRYANAVAHYEIHLSQVTSGAEKMRIAREIADTHFKFGKPAEAIVAYERLMKFATSPDDEIYLRSQILSIQQRNGVEAMARKTAARLLALKPSSPDSFKLQAKAKFIIASMDAPSARNRNIQNQKNLPTAIKTLLSDYDRIKGLFLASCEIPGLETCSSAYYETARLAEEIAKILLALELPPTLNLNEVNAVRNLSSQNTDRLQQDSKNYASMAEQALSTGAPDAETAERIRNYAQKMRGESPDTAPLE